MTRILNLALPLAIAFASALPQVATAQETAVVNPADYAGKTIYGPKGERIAPIYKVTAAGVPQVIINGQIRSVPASSLSVADGKLTTSLTKKELVKGR